METENKKSVFGEIGLFLVKFIPIYLEFIRNIGGVITLLLIAFFAYFLVDLHYENIAHPVRIEYFSRFMTVMAWLTFMLNYLQFGFALGNIIKNNNIRCGWLYKIVAHAFMLTFAILILVAISYFTSMQGYRLMDSLK